MATIKHLESKYAIASYELIKACDGDEIRFYLWLKLWAINKHSAFPSYKTICEDLGMGVRSLPRLIEKMEASGRLRVERSHRKNNIYDITGYDLLVAGFSVPKMPSKTAEVAVKLRQKLPSNEDVLTNRKLTKVRPEAVQTLPVMKVERKKTPLRLIVDHFFHAQGWIPENNPAYAQHLRSGAELLKQCGGDVDAANAAIDLAADWFKGKSLSWNLNTLLRNWNEVTKKVERVVRDLNAGETRVYVGTRLVRTEKLK